MLNRLIANKDHIGRFLLQNFFSALIFSVVIHMVFIKDGIEPFIDNNQIIKPSRVFYLKIFCGALILVNLLALVGEYFSQKISTHKGYKNISGVIIMSLTLVFVYFIDRLPGLMSSTNSLIVIFLFTGGLLVWGGQPFLSILTNTDRVIEKSTSNAHTKGLWIISLFALAYIIYFSALTCQNHLGFRTYAYDLGIFDQVIYKLSRFKDSHCTITLKDHLYDEHFSPILILIAPLYRIFDHPMFLLIFQSAMLGGASIFIYLICYKQTSHILISLALSISYLYHPALHGVNTYDFHEIALFPFFILGSLYFLKINKLIYFFIFLVLGVMCKEETSTYAFMVGLYIVFVEKRPKLGLSVSIPSLMYYFIVTNFVLTRTFLAERFGGAMSSDFGDGFSSIIITIVSNPLYFIKYTLGNLDKLYFWFILLIPMLFLPLFSRTSLIIVAASAAISILSSTRGQYEIWSQYSAAVIPFLFFVSVDTLKYIPSRYFIILAIGVFYSSFYFNQTRGKFLDRSLIVMASKETHGRDAKLFNSMIGFINPNSSVSAQCTIVPHLTHRDSIFTFPMVFNSDYILVDGRSNLYPLNGPQWYEQVQNIKKEGKYGLFKNKDFCFLFKKGYKTDENYVVDRISLAALTNCGLKRINDTNSWCSEVVMAQPSDAINSPYIIWGPFTSLESGNYEFKFALKTDNNKLNEVVALIDVYANEIKTLKEIKGTDFITANQYQTFSLFLNLGERLDKVEYRVGYNKKVTIYADYVDAIRK